MQKQRFWIIKSYLERKIASKTISWDFFPLA